MNQSEECRPQKQLCTPSTPRYEVGTCGLRIALYAETLFEAGLLTHGIITTSVWAAYRFQSGAASRGEGAAI